LQRSVGPVRALYVDDTRRHRNDPEIQLGLDEDARDTTEDKISEVTSIKPRHIIGEEKTEWAQHRLDPYRRRLSERGIDPLDSVCWTWDDYVHETYYWDQLKPVDPDGNPDWRVEVTAYEQELAEEAENVRKVKKTKVPLTERERHGQRRKRSLGKKCSRRDGSVSERGNRRDKDDSESFVLYRALGRLSDFGWCPVNDDEITGALDAAMWEGERYDDELLELARHRHVPYWDDYDVHCVNEAVETCIVTVDDSGPLTRYICNPAIPDEDEEELAVDEILELMANGFDTEWYERFDYREADPDGDILGTTEPYVLCELIG
jgi:hypothetical protein